MCGILGCINYSHLDFARSKSLLKHRGPDENAEFFYENLFLFHTRLSILDIKHGHQPFFYKDYVLIFNGQIYNHIELRNEFDLSCSTNSDTETLIHLYDKIGKEALNHIDGMFAFAVFNKTTKKLFLARDRAGEKPLYYYLTNGSLIFGSELNAVIAPLKPEIDHEKIYQYLRYSFINSNTPYKEVFELIAGSWMEVDIKTLQIVSHQWWKIEEFYVQDNRMNHAEALSSLEEYLKRSIRRRLSNSDLEVGTFLSGGIDSGLVTAIASEYQTNLKTFTISFPGHYDESKLAKLVADKYETVHTVIPISFSDLENDLVKILTNYGEPYSDSSAIPSYYICREAKKNLTVILNGDGADELFGGYRRYVPFAKYDFFRSGKSIKEISSLISSLLPHPTDKKTTYNYIYRLFDFASKNPVNSYLSATSDFFEGHEKSLQASFYPFVEMEEYLRLLSSLRMSGLDKIMCLDFKFLFANDLLVKMDIATMAHSLEGRTPFLSKELLEFAPALPENLKIQGISTKYLLRRLAHNYLPTELVNRPKSGFEVPLRNWVENELKEMVFYYLSGNTFSENFINKKFLNQLLADRVKVPREKRAKMLWTLLALEIWYIHCYKDL